MSFIPFLMKTLGSTAMAVGKATTGGTLGRMALGGTLGFGAGVLGAMGNDDPNQKVKSILAGTLMGALGGASTRLMTPAIRYGKKGALTTGMPIGLKAMGYAGKAGFGAAKLAAKYPKTALLGGLAVGGGILGSAAADSILGDQTSSLSYDMSNPMGPHKMRQEDIAMSQMNTGVSPMSNMTTGTGIRSRRIGGSTSGLVQGLHRSRH